MARSSAIFCSESGMNACPPNPGSTLMINTMSTDDRMSRSTSTDVAGLIEMPTRAPTRRIAAMQPGMSRVAS